MCRGVGCVYLYWCNWIFHYVREVCVILFCCRKLYPPASVSRSLQKRLPRREAGSPVRIRRGLRGIAHWVSEHRAIARLVPERSLARRSKLRQSLAEVPQGLGRGGPTCLSRIIGTNPTTSKNARRYGATHRHPRNIDQMNKHRYHKGALPKYDKIYDEPQKVHILGLDAKWVVPIVLTISWKRNLRKTWFLWIRWVISVELY